MPPPDEAARGQLLRVMASDAMWGAIQRRYGVRLAFQNCHRVAVFRPEAEQARAGFITARSQLLNQRPEPSRPLIPGRLTGRPVQGGGYTIQA